MAGAQRRNRCRRVSGVPSWAGPSCVAYLVRHAACRCSVMWSGVDLRTPLQDSLRIGRQLGPIFRRKAFGKEIVFVWGAKLAAELADESRFAKHVGLGVANLRPVAGDGLFTAYNHEPNWQLAHDVLAPGFSREAMEGYHPMMLDVTGRLTDRWDGERAAGRAVDVPGDMTKLTLETIARTGFGHDFGSFERTRPHPFVTAMVGALLYAQRLNAVPVPLAPVLLRSATRRNSGRHGVPQPHGRRRGPGPAAADLPGTATCWTGCWRPPTRRRANASRPRTSAARSSPS